MVMQTGQRAKGKGQRSFLPLAILFFPAALLTAQQDSWTQFRGNPGLTGVSTSAPPPALKMLWSVDIGKEDAIESSPAIADGRVFVGAASGHLIALNLADGKELWRYQVEQGIGPSSPAVSGGLVYIGDLAGVFHAVNASDGKAAWTFKTKAEIKSSPVVVGDRVLIGSYDTNLYALSAKDGKLVWSAKTENYVHGTPAVADGLVYFAGCDEVFHAVRVADGKEAFHVSMGAYTAASVALAGGNAYFGTFNNEVVSLNLKSRAVTWRYSHPDRQFPFYSSAAVSDGLVVLGGRDKMVHGLDAASGKARWTFLTRARVDSSPVIAGNRVFVGSNDGRFYVLALASGEKLWEFDAGGPLSASPAVAAGRIVVGSEDGRLICFG